MTIQEGGKTPNKDIERAKELLASAGFKVSVGGCGCCQSPWVKIEHNGNLILDADRAGFDMFDDGSPQGD